ncbi:Uncharacterised protein [uncultured archaeon]|nr:Uncharacterised protein [uncultured archaeon]
MDQKTKELAVVKFNKIKGSSGNSLFVSEKGGDLADSMKALEANGLRVLASQEALSLLIKDETLKNALKGKWFYLAGAGTDKDGLFAVNEEGGTVDRKADVEHTVRVWSGKQPSLNVLSDCNARIVERRFDLGASGGPSGVAPVVLGVPKEKILQRGTENDKTPLAVVQAELRDHEKVLKEKKEKKTSLNEEAGALDKEIAEREKRVAKLKEVEELLRKE